MCSSGFQVSQNKSTKSSSSLRRRERNTQFEDNSRAQMNHTFVSYFESVSNRLF